MVHLLAKFKARGWEVPGQLMMQGEIQLARSVSSGWSKLIMVFLGADEFINQV